MDQTRQESDSLGSLPLPKDSLSGIHTLRALGNFPLSARRIPEGLIRAYGQVKLACLQTCRDLGVWADDRPKIDAMLQASVELSEGLLSDAVVVDALQGGAGTSTNMNVNEVIANRALEILGIEHGRYDRVHPIEDINRYQSTNDTYPTALRIAAIRGIQRLEDYLIGLQEAFQAKEKQFAGVVKVGRTQLQDAVLTTVGREMSAYAEAVNRDRWRVYKCVERLRVVNLGGTAIGSGLGAPRDYIFRVVDTLRGIAGLHLARADNLVDATQNADVFVEVSGILKACATSLLKISTDLRLLSSGPQAGFAEIRLPPRQAGSSIMPGKINPVIPEAVTQVAMLVMGYDSVIAAACASGNLELNPFLPLVALCLLDAIDLLANACDILRRNCVEGIVAEESRCRASVEGSTAIVTALVPVIGYDRACRIAREAQQQDKTVRQIVIEQDILSAEQFERLISPEAVCRLGFVQPDPAQPERNS